MIKKLFLFALIATIFVSCAETKKEKTEDAEGVSAVSSDAPTALTVANFEEKAAELANAPVTIEGTVDHVCQHGGKRMFLIAEGTEGRVKITTSENLASFDTELEGSDVFVVGYIEELIIDEDYLVEWEAELMEAEDHEQGEGEDHSHEGEHQGKGEQADQGEHVAGMTQIESLRAQIAESDKDYLAFYSIVCEKFKVIEAEKEEPVEK